MPYGRIRLRAAGSVDRRWMPGEWRHRDLHEGEERKRREQRVQLVMVGSIEDADVGVLPGNPPQMPPFAGALELLRTFLLLRLQPLEALRSKIVRHAHI